MPVTFTIGFICHGDFPLLEKIIPHNIDVLCKNTAETYDIVLIADGAESVDTSKFIKSASKWGINELRFRWRKKNCANGDPSNNGHLHLFSDKTPYLVTLEGDVALFKTNPAFDILHEFRKLFERNEKLALATRMDDHACWVWRMEDAGPDLEKGVRSVNRVASHFLVYNTARARKLFTGKKILTPELFHDDGSTWFNYEDFLSSVFAEPAGPGIAFVTSFPMKVYHCDVKVSDGNVHYTKQLHIKKAEFERRKIETMKVKKPTSNLMTQS